MYMWPLCFKCHYIQPCISCGGKLKGGQKKRGRTKLLLMQILKYFTEIKYIFWQHQCIVEIKLMNWYKTHFSWMLKKKKIILPKNTFSVSEGAPLKTLKFFFGKMKNACGFLVFYSKNYIYETTSVHCSGKNLELVKK